MNHPPYDSQGLLSLAYRIIKLERQEYECALRYLLNHKEVTKEEDKYQYFKQEDARRRLNRATEFFKSDWFNILSLDANADWVLEEMNRKVRNGVSTEEGTNQSDSEVSTEDSGTTEDDW